MSKFHGSTYLVTRHIIIFTCLVMVLKSNQTHRDYKKLIKFHFNLKQKFGYFCQSVISCNKLSQNLNLPLGYIVFKNKSTWNYILR